MIKIKAQDMASYAAVIVACVALYVGWDQARIGRNQQHADVFPVIQLLTNYVVKTTSGGKTVRHLSLKVSNAGVGPAFIESSKWEIGGKSIVKVSQLSELMPDGLQILDEFQGQPDKFLLAAGADIVVWEIAWPTDAQSQPLIDSFLATFWAMDLSLCYCSLYERCWKTSYNAESPRPKAVKQCGIEN